MRSIKCILPVFTVLFLGYLGFSLALPIFPPLFLDLNHSFLPATVTISSRRILLGILFSMYPLGQFIGAPIMGKLSDKYGRKPVLLISLLAVIPAYIGCALSVSFAIPWLLYTSRLLCGLLEGNITIAQATISDISENTRAKTKNFGWLVSLSSSAFLIGPLIGGKLADAKLVSWFHYDTPFWCAAFLVLIGFFIVWLLFKETSEADPDIEIHPIKIFFTMIEGFKIRALRGVFAVNFFVYLAVFFFLNFFSAFLVDVFQFGVSSLGEANAYLAAFSVLSPFFFGKLSKHLPTHKTLLWSLFILAASLVIFCFPKDPRSLFFTLIPIGICMAISFSFPAIMISDGVSKRFQGRALGTNQSLQVFAEGATALTGGFLMASFNSLPIWTGAVCALIGGFILLKFKIPSEQQH